MFGQSPSPLHPCPTPRPAPDHLVTQSAANPPLCPTASLGHRGGPFPGKLPRACANAPAGRPHRHRLRPAPAPADNWPIAPHRPAPRATALPALLFPPSCMSLLPTERPCPHRTLAWSGPEHTLRRRRGQLTRPRPTRSHPEARPPRPTTAVLPPAPTADPHSWPRRNSPRPAPSRGGLRPNSATSTVELRPPLVAGWSDVIKRPHPGQPRSPPGGAAMFPACHAGHTPTPRPGAAPRQRLCHRARLAPAASLWLSRSPCRKCPAAPRLAPERDSTPPRRPRPQIQQAMNPPPTIRGNPGCCRRTPHRRIALDPCPPRTAWTFTASSHPTPYPPTRRRAHADCHPAARHTPLAARGPLRPSR